MVGAANETGGASGVRRLIWLIAGVGFAVSLAANWPGHYSVDSVSQLAQGRDGLYDDWHPPIMAWLLGLADRLTPHAVGFVVADTLLFFAALTVFATGERRPRPAAAVLMALAAATPQVLVFQGVVWKDILFADATVGAFAALAVAGRLWRSRVWRWTALGFAFVLFLLATLTRQTGFVSPLAGAASFAAIALTRRDARSRAAGPILAQAGGALVAITVLASVVGFAFTLRDDGEPGAAGQLAMLQTFDLAGALNLDPRLPLPAVRASDGALEWFLRAEAGPRYRPGTADYVDDLPAADAVLPPKGPAIGQDWRRLILQRPGLYLETRARVFWATLATPESQSCPVVSTGVQTDDKVDLARAGLTPRRDAKDVWDEAFVFTLIGTPVLSHLVWGALAMGLLALGVRDVAWRGDRRPESLAMIGLLVAAFAYVAGFLVISVACDYRYLYLLDVAAIIAAVGRAAHGPPPRSGGAGLEA